MRNRTEHGLSWLTAISDAGSTPAASTITLRNSFGNGYTDLTKLHEFEEPATVITYLCVGRLHVFIKAPIITDIGK